MHDRGRVTIFRHLLVCSLLLNLQVDLGSSMESRGLSSEKLQAAQKAASYLEEGRDEGREGGREGERQIENERVRERAREREIERETEKEEERDRESKNDRLIL